MTRHLMSLEIKVGLFIVGGVALLIFFLFTIGDIGTYFQPGYGLRVVFDSANGIGRGSPVQYAGMEVGKVKNVQLVHPTGSASPKVELLVQLPQSVVVRSDDDASISTFGLLGEKYLELSPGPGEGTVLKADDILIGKPPVSTERIIERSNEVLTELKQTLAGINSLVGDPEARIYLKETMQEARDATRYWKLLGARLNLAMSHAEAGEGSLGKLLFDEALYQEMVVFVHDLQQHPWKLLVRPKASPPSTSSPQP